MWLVGLYELYAVSSFVRMKVGGLLFGRYDRLLYSISLFYRSVILSWCSIGLYLLSVYRSVILSVVIGSVVIFSLLFYLMFGL